MAIAAPAAAAAPAVAVAPEPAVQYFPQGVEIVQEESSAARSDAENDLDDRARPLRRRIEVADRGAAAPDRGRVVPAGDDPAASGYRRRTTFKLGDPREMVTRATDLEKALEASCLGDLRWLGDPSLLPRERVGATLAPPDEPWFQAHNLAHLEAMLAAKLLAATLLAGDNDTVNPVRINEEILDWRDIAGDSVSATKLSTTEAVRAAFILLEKSLGRSARTVRDETRRLVPLRSQGRNRSRRSRSKGDVGDRAPDSLPLHSSRRPCFRGRHSRDATMFQRQRRYGSLESHGQRRQPYPRRTA